MKNFSFYYSRVPLPLLALYSRVPLYNMLFYRLLKNEPETYIERLYASSGYAWDERDAVLRDMTREFWLHGVHFDEYFCYDFYKKDAAYKRSFVNETQRFRYYNKLNTLRGMRRLDDKYETYRRYGAYFRRELLAVRGEADYRAFEAFVRRHPVFVKKPFDSYFGNGVELVRTQDGETRALFDRFLAEGRFLCEEYVRQCAALAAFNESSLNTVRMPTIVTGNRRDGYDVRLFYPCLRNGRRGSVVDNGGAGGLFIQLDAQTGRALPTARDESNNAYTAHPDSGVVYDGFVMPRWDEAVALARELALLCPENRYTGWDLALTDDGWVLIEGNGRAQFITMQICDRVGKKAELDEIIKLCK